MYTAARSGISVRVIRNHDSAAFDRRAGNEDLLNADGLGMKRLIIKPETRNLSERGQRKEREWR